jgi:hypothetical protein
MSISKKYENIHDLNEILKTADEKKIIENVLLITENVKPNIESLKSVITRNFKNQIIFKELIDILIKKGVVPNTKILKIASENKKPFEFIKYLISCGAKPNVTYLNSILLSNDVEDIKYLYYICKVKINNESLSIILNENPINIDKLKVILDNDKKFPQNIFDIGIKKAIRTQSKLLIETLISGGARILYTKSLIKNISEFIFVLKYLSPKQIESHFSNRFFTADEFIDIIEKTLILNSKSLLQLVISHRIQIPTMNSDVINRFINLKYSEELLLILFNKYNNVSEYNSETFELCKKHNYKKLKDFILNGIQTNIIFNKLLIDIDSDTNENLLNEIIKNIETINTFNEKQTNMIINGLTMAYKIKNIIRSPDIIINLFFNKLSYKDSNEINKLDFIFNLGLSEKDILKILSDINIQVDNKYRLIIKLIKNKFNEDDCIEFYNKHIVDFNQSQIYYVFIDHEELVNFFIKYEYINLLRVIVKTKYIYLSQVSINVIIKSKCDEKNLLFFIKTYISQNSYYLKKHNDYLVLEIIKTLKDHNRSDECINLLSEYVIIPQRKFKKITDKDLIINEHLWKSYCQELPYHLGLYDLRQILNNSNIAQINNKPVLEASKTEICEFLNSYSYDKDVNVKLYTYTKKCNTDHDLSDNDWSDIGDHLIVQDSHGYCYSYEDIIGMKKLLKTWPRDENSVHPYMNSKYKDLYKNNDVEYNKLLDDLDNLYHSQSQSQNQSHINNIDINTKAEIILTNKQLIANFFTNLNDNLLPSHNVYLNLNTQQYIDFIDLLQTHIGSIPNIRQYLPQGDGEDGVVTNNMKYRLLEELKLMYDENSYDSLSTLLRTCLEPFL